MSFFQNVFNEYQGFWSLGDHKDYALTFKVPGNKNTGEVSLAWENGPYDLSASGILTINVAIDQSSQFNQKQHNDQSVKIVTRWLK